MTDLVRPGQVGLLRRVQGLIEAKGYARHVYARHLLLWTLRSNPSPASQRSACGVARSPDASVHADTSWGRVRAHRSRSRAAGPRLPSTVLQGHCLLGRAVKRRAALRTAAHCLTLTRPAPPSAQLQLPPRSSTLTVRLLSSLCAAAS